MGSCNSGGKSGGGVQQPAQQPTHAYQIQDMNEAQLLKEIPKLERSVRSALKEVERASNTSSMRFFNDIREHFPDGVGGSAVDSKYKKMQERYRNDMGKLVEAQQKHTDRAERLQEMKDAYKKIKGTGKTLRTVAMATASKGNGTWTKTTFTTLGKTVNAQKMGNLIAAKPFYTYNLYDARTGNQIKTFKSFKALDAYVKKNT